MPYRLRPSELFIRRRTVNRRDWDVVQDGDTRSAGRDGESSDSSRSCGWRAMRGIVKNSCSPFLSVHGASSSGSVVSASRPRAAATLSIELLEQRVARRRRLRPAVGSRVEVEHWGVERRRAPEGNVGQMPGELAERHRLVVGFPGELRLGHAVEEAASRRHLVVELGEQRVGDRHAPRIANLFEVKSCISTFRELATPNVEIPDLTPRRYLMSSASTCTVVISSLPPTATFTT